MGDGLKLPMAYLSLDRKEYEKKINFESKSIMSDQDAFFHAICDSMSCKKLPRTIEIACHP